MTRPRILSSMPLQPQTWPFVQLAGTKSAAGYVLGCEPKVVKCEAIFQGPYTLRPIINLSAYTCRAATLPGNPWSRIYDVKYA